jgi:uncharacterized protein (TIGR03905 family)
MSRYIYRTQGVCPPEIHFEIEKNRLKSVRFVGGGCPGNAALVSRLLQDMPLEDVEESLKNIDCRNNTSCPDQLARAVAGAVSGKLPEAESFRVKADSVVRNRVALVGELEGRGEAIEKILELLEIEDVDAVYIAGNLTGENAKNEETVSFLKKQKKAEVFPVAGDRDYRYSLDSDAKSANGLAAREKDFLYRLPQVVSFYLEDKTAMVFYGAYIQEMPGYSDYEPFALEMNMVCNLSRFLEDESVFPALEAMTAQFTADIVIFGQPGTWRHKKVGNIDFIGTGPLVEDGRLVYATLEMVENEVKFQVHKKDLTV